MAKLMTFEERGMAWWSSLSDDEALTWLMRTWLEAGRINPSIEDAYRFYLCLTNDQERSRRQSCKRKGNR